MWKEHTWSSHAKETHVKRTHVELTCERNTCEKNTCGAHMWTLHMWKEHMWSSHVDFTPVKGTCGKYLFVINMCLSTCGAISNSHVDIFHTWSYGISITYSTCDGSKPTFKYYRYLWKRRVTKCITVSRVNCNSLDILGFGYVWIFYVSNFMIWEITLKGNNEILQFFFKFTYSIVKETCNIIKFVDCVVSKKLQCF